MNKPVSEQPKRQKDKERKVIIIDKNDKESLSSLV